MSFSEWKEVKIEDVCRIRRGASPRPIQKYISESGIPWVKIADATSSHSRYIERTNEFIIEEGKLKSRYIEKGTLILSNSATPGIPKIMGINACVHDGWLIIDEFKDTVKEFLYYLFINERLGLLNLSNGSVFRNLKTDIVKSYQVKIPTVKEQKAIAHILSTLDEKIEVNNKINKTLENMAQAIFKQWFVDFEFPNEDGEPYKSSGGEMVESEFGMIPKGWEVSRLSSIADITMGQSPKGTSYNEEGKGIVFYQGRTDFGDRYPNIRLYTTEPKRMAKSGNVLMSVRAPVGDINIAYEDCCIGRGLCSIRSINGNSSYVFHLMISLKEKLNVYNGEGTVFGSINKNTLNTMPLIKPIDSVIDKFDRVVSSLDKKYLYNIKENRILTTIRDTILPKLMSGEIRVPLESDSQN